MTDMTKYTDQEIKNMYINSKNYLSDKRMKEQTRNHLAKTSGKKSHVASRANKAVDEVLRLVEIEFKKRGLTL